MKQSILLLSLIINVMIVSGRPKKELSPFRNAVKVWNFAGEEGLKTIGDVRIGATLAGKEKAASMNRGGDGRVAEFNGGWLVTDPGIKVTGKQMTLLMRVRDLSGNWKGTLLARQQAGDHYANLLYESLLDLKKLGFRERARMKDGRSIEFLWQTDPLACQAIPEFLSESKDNPYKLSIDSMGRSKTWTKEIFPWLYPGLRDGVLKIAAPVELIGPFDWHDILVRFTGPKLELFIDGVLVDEEYPHGELRNFASPFLIGAGFQNGEVKATFRGQMDHLAIWDRALTDDEIVFLSGGQKHIALRRIEIDGEPAKAPQYWRPEGYNAFMGDPMPVFHDGTFHFFYLFDRKHCELKWGVGVHTWGHMSSNDLIHWERQPKATEVTEQTENAFGTGSVIFHDGTYYLYWINHGRRLVFSDSPDHRRADNIYVARSTDGIHFQKQTEPWVRIDYLYSGDVNPLVWKAAKGDRFYLYISGPPGHENWYFESDDLRTWKPTKIPALDNVHAACCSYYPWNGKYYWFDWYSGYRMSLTPIEDPDTKLMDLVPLKDAWAVPQVAPFTGNRMLMVGFTLPVSIYGTQSLFRELVQNPDGTVGLKWPLEMIPASGPPVSLNIQQMRGDMSGDASSLRLSVAGKDTLATCFAEKIPQNVRITLRVVPESGASGFGLCVRGQGNFISGKELCFEPNKTQFRYADAPAGSDVVPLINGVVPSGLADVTGLDRPFNLDVIVRDDYVDVCIDNRRTLFHQRPNDSPRGDRLFFFVRKGAVKFEDIKVRPLFR